MNLPSRYIFFLYTDPVLYNVQRSQLQASPLSISFARYSFRFLRIFREYSMVYQQNGCTLLNVVQCTVGPLCSVQRVQVHSIQMSVKVGKKIIFVVYFVR